MPRVTAVLRLRRLLPLFIALLSALWAPGARADEPPPPPGQTLTEAQFELLPAGEPERVLLPDTWALRGVRDGRAVGRYTVGFDLTSVPAESMALMFTRLSTRHRLWINGRPLANQAMDDAFGNPGFPRPALLELSPALLQAGHNTVVIEVVHAQRAGLSSVDVGPMVTLRARYLRHLLVSVELPQALNMACGGLALLLVLIWRRRPSEVALGSFGVIALVGSVRNYSYFLDTSVTGTALWADWFFFAINVWIVALFGVFAQAFAGQRWPRYRRWLLGLAIVVPALGLVATGLDRLQELRGYAYPVLIGTCLPGLWLCLAGARAKRPWGAVGPALGMGAMVGAGVHDYMFQTAYWLPMTETFWMPYVMPVTLGIISLALVRRMVHALSEVEALNTELEARVAARTRELELANAAKTRFLASASHDLRQPLVTIGLLVGLAKDRSDSPQTRQLMNRVDEAVGSMEGLLTGLLDLSRLEAGAVKPDPGPVRLAAVFDAIDAHEHAAASLKGLRLRFRATDAVVWSDALMLERILRNLVANAVRYTERGGVLVAARRRGGRVVIEVRDSGIGIAPEHQQAIFQEFVQVDNPARDGTKGMGLGLAIVQRSAAMLGHRIGLESALGRGSRFWVELPPAEAPQAAFADAAPGDMPDEPVPLQGRRVLLVEDDASVRAAMIERLQAWGAQVVAAHVDVPSLEAWLANLHQPAPDLMVSDYRLPHGDGLQAIAAARRRFGALPALLVTGDIAPHDLARLHDAGLRVLHKPFRPEALRDALLEALLAAEDAAETIAPPC